MSLIVAPEGTRSLTGEMGEFKKGAFHVALHTKVPIVLIGLCGAYRAKRKGDWRIMPGIITVKISTPITAATYEHMSVNELRDYVRNEMVQLIQSPRRD